MMSNEIRVVFDSFDTDGNGLLDKDELKNAFKDFKGGLTDKEVDTLIAEADTDNNGQVSFEEFVALIKKLS
jgi:Ca2+-binding EF-hand superfamily protein